MQLCNGWQESLAVVFWHRLPPSVALERSEWRSRDGGFGGVNLFAQGSLLHSISPDFCRRFHISSKGKSVPLEAKRAPSSSRS